MGGGEVGDLGGVSCQRSTNWDLGEEVPNPQGGILGGGYNEPAAVQLMRPKAVDSAWLAKGTDPLLGAKVPYVNLLPTTLDSDDVVVD